MHQVDILKIEKAARTGGEVLKKYFGQSLEQTVKGTVADVKTKADDESEKAIHLSLKADFPRVGFVLEEKGGIETDKDIKFVVDPLDGTNNFVLGIPNFTVSIALYEKEKIVAGIVFNPILNRMYNATLNGGAKVNGKGIVVSRESKISQSTVAYASNYFNSAEYQSDVFRKLNDLKIKRILNSWSPAFDFCLLAEGKIEAIINNNTDIYDFSAGKLIAKEAGAKVTAFDGEDERDDKNPIFVASNGTRIHEEVINIL